MAKSTRLAIAEGALTEAVARLRDLPPSPSARRLSIRALAYRSALDRWVTFPPSAEQTAALLKVVLELDIAVMRLSQDDPEQG